jgi:putative addiction module antidote
MVQKVLKIGSSAAVTIPKKSLKELGLKIGDQVIVEIDRKKKVFLVRPVFSIDQELMDWTERFIEKYRPALEALAKK